MKLMQLKANANGTITEKWFYLFSPQAGVVMFASMGCALMLTVSLLNLEGSENPRELEHRDVHYAILYCYTLPMFAGFALLYVGANMPHMYLLVIGLAVQCTFGIYWIVISAVAFIDEPKYVYAVCIDNRCPETLWLYNTEWRTYGTECVAYVDDILAKPPMSLKNGHEQNKSRSMVNEGRARNRTCSEGLGCSDPWVSDFSLFPLPVAPSEIRTQFNLYSRADQVTGYPVECSPAIRLENFGYDPKKRTVVIVHGMASSASEPWMLDLMKGYLKNVDANVFLTDWSRGANMTSYFQAAANVRVAGAEMARLGDCLVSKKGQSPKNIHCIGHGLGAHACGYMGQNMDLHNNTIDWITGLDPAGPGFDTADDARRLSLADADFVDVYHTDAKPPLLGLGMTRPAGLVDFYMNGGKNQPGCSTAIKVRAGMLITESIRSLENYTVEDLKRLFRCPHYKAVEYFISALNGCNFVGYKSNVAVNPFDGDGEDINGCRRSSWKCQVVGLRARELAGRGIFNAHTIDGGPHCSLNETWINGTEDDSDNRNVWNTSISPRQTEVVKLLTSIGSQNQSNGTTRVLRVADGEKDLLAVLQTLLKQMLKKPSAKLDDEAQKMRVVLYISRALGCTESTTASQAVGAVGATLWLLFLVYGNVGTLILILELRRKAQPSTSTLPGHRSTSPK